MVEGQIRRLQRQNIFTIFLLLAFANNQNVRIIFLDEFIIIRHGQNNGRINLVSRGDSEYFPFQLKNFFHIQIICEETLR